jgi:hypothetical protein
MKLIVSGLKYFRGGVGLPEMWGHFAAKLAIKEALC